MIDMKQISKVYIFSVQLLASLVRSPKTAIEYLGNSFLVQTSVLETPEILPAREDPL